MDEPNPLKAWLALVGMTQVRLAELTGIPQPQLSTYITGRRRPGIDNALAIERATDGAVPVTAWAHKSIITPAAPVAA